MTPARVLDALGAAGLPGDGRILQLNSYENRVFQLFLDDGRAVVAKFYRPGRWTDAQILEEHAFALELAADEVPVVPPLVLASAPADAAVAKLQPAAAPTLATLAGGDGHRVAVANRCAGRPAELDRPGALQRLGRFVGRLHAVGSRKPFVHRAWLDPVRDAARARAVLLEGDHVGSEQRPAWQAACDAAMAGIEEAFEQTPPLRTVRLHGDCHLGNVLWRERGPHAVDLDDACQGPAVQDLWMLLSGDPADLPKLLAGYREFADFDARQWRLVEALRTLRMIRHSAWLAERWLDPAFPVAFPFFGTAAYWSQQTALLREQLSAMAESRSPRPPC